ncbi:MAG: hypothetical protein KAI47_08485 [Deltaproteobacteria bacterium]|nr:hypothetical protein [Deltaproteobacteria bacterium]
MEARLNKLMQTGCSAILVACLCLLALACSDNAAPSADATTDVAQGRDSRLPQLDAGCVGPDLFLYTDDFICGWNSVNTDSGRCLDMGDGRCYQRCATDDDCPDPQRPRCAILGLFAESDYNCTKHVKVCREAHKKDECPSY